MKTMSYFKIVGIVLACTAANSRVMACDGRDPIYGGFVDSCGPSDPIRGPIDSCDGRDPIYGGFVHSCGGNDPIYGG